MALPKAHATWLAGQPELLSPSARCPDVIGQAYPTKHPSRLAGPLNLTSEALAVATDEGTIA
jgi:hypothetical protein